jgi:hypothetical protein
MMPASSPAAADAQNLEIADKLRQAAALLAAQGASPPRVAAYRRAADTLEQLPERVTDLLDRSGRDGLMALPGIGGSLAAAIEEMARTGRWSQLDRLRGAVDPERLFQTIPGLGPELARRLHDTLHVDTLEDLEVAAHDGRIEAVPGMGPRRVLALRAALAGALARVRGRAPGAPRATVQEPSIDLLLDVDREYRERAARGDLRRIAPRRFNPAGEAWLPILHTQRGAWHFTALFSNTALAHQLGRTDDWVVLYFYDGDHRERQRTVVTETRGPLAGCRVVRGREAEQLAASAA